MEWDLIKSKKELDSNYSSFKKDIEKVFDDFFSFKPSTLFESQWLPTIDMEEDEKAIHVKAELPGIEEKNLNITLEQNILTISGEKTEENKNESKKYIFSERKFGSFSRSVTLPEGIKSNEIKANYKKGILTIEIPRHPSVMPKKIQINVK